MAIGNMHKNLVKIGLVVFELCERTNKQTDGQKYSSQCNATDHPPYPQLGYGW